MHIACDNHASKNAVAVGLVLSTCCAFKYTYAGIEYMVLMQTEVEPIC